MVHDLSLIAFKAISGFIKDVSDEHGDSIHAVALYNHLLSKTTLQHTKAIEKHHDLFRDFCVKNRIAIQERSIDDLQPEPIEYSDNIKIDISEIFKQTTKENIEIIWKHLLTISAIVDQSGEARRVLREMSAKDGSKNEGDFLSNLIDKIETAVDPDADPMTSISSLMSSGVFTDLVEGMGNGLQDGSLDLNKLMGSVQGMMSKMNQSGSDDGEGGAPPLDMSGMLNMLGPMLNQGGAPNSGGAPPLDMSGMLNMLGPMLNQGRAPNSELPNSLKELNNHTDVLKTKNSK